MKKVLLILAGLFLLPAVLLADDPAFFKLGPLSLEIPLKTTRITYLYDFHAQQNLVGGETPVLSVWNRVEGTVGAVTSLQGQGTPFVGGNVLIGNVLDKYVTLPPDISFGGFGGWNFNSNAPIYGVKASLKLW